MLIDTHVHSEISFDCSMPLEEILEAAKAADVGVCITDHLDLNMSFEGFDPEDYLNKYAPLHSDKLFLGTECGMDPRYAKQNREFLAISSPDFTLGSVHTIQDDDIYERSTYEKYEEQEFWARYFSWALECLRSHPFIDSLAHLDYPGRLSPYGVKGFSFQRHEKGLVPIYEFLAKQEKALELNLRRYSADSRAEFREHFNAFRELGGRYVTLGSDSHGPSTIGYNFRDAAKLVESLDLTVVHYLRHEPLRDYCP